jgi:hypothetical protein
VKLHIIIPYSNSKDLGKAYNESMELIPEGDSALIMDYDVMLLTPDAPKIISEYAELYPKSVLTCFTNRIHPLNTEQLMTGIPDVRPNITQHLIMARQQAKNQTTVTEVTQHFSGFLFVLPKEVWKANKFKETGQCLGVDTEWFKQLKTNSVPVLRMNRIYVWHTYRLLNGIQNKEHLK